jgi:Zn finger protein HypA/HybF involved in hydrogenase expression
LCRYGRRSAQLRIRKVRFMDAVGRYAAILLAVLLIFLFPLQYIAQAQDETMNDVVSAYTAEFTDKARHQGYITLDMYEELLQKINQTGELYDVSIETSHPVSGKEIADLTIGDKMPEPVVENTSLTGFIPSESSEDNIQSFSTHTHTDDCYAGHRHSGSCTSTGEYYLSGPEVNYIGSVQYISWSNQLRIYIICGDCGSEVGMIIFHYSPKEADNYIAVSTMECYQSGSLYAYGYLHTNYIFEYIYTSEDYEGQRTLNPEWSRCRNLFDSIGVSDYKKETVTGYFYLNNTTLKHLGYRIESGCPFYNYQNRTTSAVHLHQKYACDYVYDSSKIAYPIELPEDTTPICDQVVISIVATNPNQTVNKGGNIVTTATATMLNGSTKTVSCTSNYNPNLVGPQDVTLTYSGLVGNAKTTGTRTCRLQATVKSLRKLTKITVSPSQQNIFRYQNPEISVTAFYDDNTSKTVTGYTISGFKNGILGAQQVTVAYDEEGITITAAVTVTVNQIEVTCPICETSYPLDEQDKDNGCPICKNQITKIIATPENISLTRGDTLSVAVEAVYADGGKFPITGWTSSFNPDIIGFQEVTVSYLGFYTHIMVEVNEKLKTCRICGKEYSMEEDGTDSGCPYCSKEIVSIKVNEEQVTIEKYQPLSITVIGTFKDGHTEEVADWSSDLVADTAGTFDVTIFYQSASDHLTVTILEEDLIQCTYCGLKYHFADSPGGCPECYKTIVSMEAGLRNGGYEVMYKSQLNLQIVLNFRDTHRQLTYTGWTVEGYQPDLLGEQEITVYYEGFSTKLNIVVVDELPKVSCPAGHEYYLNDDGSDPGCPYCAQEGARDKAVFYFDTTYTADLLLRLYSDGIYYLDEGDYITVTVTQKNVSLRTKLKNIFFGINHKVTGKNYSFGGEVIL